MSKCIWMAAACYVFAYGHLAGAGFELSVKAESAILINADTGAVLYEKNSRKIHYPASITKIATVLYALKERGNKLDKLITAEHDAIASISAAEMTRSNYSLPSHWLIPGASHIGIKKGEALSLKDLLYATMIASGGDSANVIASYIGGTIPVFMKLLNAYLKEIGCTDTVFKNPHGLHHPLHVTTAWDMAILTREAMKDPIFREIVKTVRYQRPQTNKQSPCPLIQTNRLLRKGKSYYSKAIGVKTGSTSQAQSTLVAAAQDGDRMLIAVLLKCKERDDTFADAKKLFEAAFKEKKQTRQFGRPGIQKTALELPDGSRLLKTYLKQGLKLEFYPSEEPKVKCLLKWDELKLPIRKDQKVGVLELVNEEGKTLAFEHLYAANDVGHYWLAKRTGIFALGLVGLGLIGVLIYRRKA